MSIHSADDRLCTYFFHFMFFCFQTECMVQDASKNISLFVDERRSAAYNEGRIDAELKLARESVENLAIHKAAIIERR